MRSSKTKSIKRFNRYILIRIIFLCIGVATLSDKELKPVIRYGVGIPSCFAVLLFTGIMEKDQ